MISEILIFDLFIMISMILIEKFPFAIDILERKLRHSYIPAKLKRNKSKTISMKIVVLIMQF